MIVDFKYEALYIHRENPEVVLVEKLIGSLYLWMELCVPTLHRSLIMNKSQETMVF